MMDSMSSFLIKNVTVVSAEGHDLMDVYVRDGRVFFEGDAEEEIDGTGKYLLPGAIDVHVHFRDPGAPHKETFQTGEQAALWGGITRVVDMPNNNPPVVDRASLVSKIRRIGGTTIHSHFYMGGTYDAATGKTNIDEYLASDAVALKVYMGSSTGSLLVDDEAALNEIFEKAAQADRLVCVHAEDELLMTEHEERIKQEHGGVLPDDPTIHPEIRDDEVAYRAVRRALHLAKKYGTRLHICHVSTAKELEEIREFKQGDNEGRISCEVTPHHLFATQKELALQGNLARMNPPLRKKADSDALMEGLRDGTVDIVATDHAPHTLEEKNVPYADAPSGVPGVETMLPLLLDAVNHGQLTLEDVVRVTCVNPSRVFRLGAPTRVESGGLADLVLVDMDRVQVVENGGAGALKTKVGWSLFTGRELRGWPIMTIVDGQVVVRMI